MQNCVTLMNLMTPGKMDKKSALTMRVANTGGNLSSSSRWELIFLKSTIISFIRTENRPWLVSGQDSLCSNSVQMTKKNLQYLSLHANLKVNGLEFCFRQIWHFHAVIVFSLESAT